MTFGETIRQARIELGLSIGDLSADIGIKRKVLLEIETGHSKPPTDNKVCELARMLLLDEDALMQLAEQARFDCTWHEGKPVFDRCRQVRDDEGASLW